MDAEDTLKQVAEEVSICTQCTLAGTRKLAVPGEGPATAQVMLIGEGPGFHENEQGRPFVGAAGKFLDELLAKGGFKCSEVFITNVVKCRPQDNRDPLPEDLSACAGFLDRQIAIINPLVIITLGRFSMAKYFENVRISEVHGQPKWIGSRFIIPMFHPAAALHQPKYRPMLQEDFSHLPQLVAEAQQKIASSQPKAEHENPAQLSLF